ncbi:HAD family phosphatase [Pseudorhodobacter sp. E13]|uniref:HAD family hydrolase n=1 Tax=Pseudorhodobacter sp. E13 TaxID=2487931 RepID=UPI000F8E9684|nr:HAD family phosphatase [Pseudorhodobacter sp. E13]RUS58915.1 HAD family phosphatase [Pseudorhodobacter sp. E13]
MAVLDDLPPFKALIFDCDGTLVLSAGLHFAAFSQALARQGAAMDAGWYAARTGLARRDLLTELRDSACRGLDVPRAVRDSIAATAGLAATCRANPPVLALARHWFGRVPMAVASNAEAEVVQAMLGACGIAALFDPVISLTEAGVAKPDPAMFLMAAAQMGVPHSDCLVLEDSDQGLQAAAAAGMPAVDVRVEKP